MEDRGRAGVRLNAHARPAPDNDTLTVTSGWQPSRSCSVRPLDGLVYRIYLCPVAEPDRRDFPQGDVNRTDETSPMESALATDLRA